MRLRVLSLKSMISLPTSRMRLKSGEESFSSLPLNLTRLSWRNISRIPTLSPKRKSLQPSARVHWLWSALLCCVVLRSRTRVYRHCSTMFVPSCLRQWILPTSSVLTPQQVRRKTVFPLRMRPPLPSRSRLLPTRMLVVWCSSAFIPVRWLQVHTFTTPVQARKSA